MSRYNTRWLIGIAWLFILTSCTNTPIKPEQSQQTGSVVLDRNTQVSQTFTAHFNGLTQVVIPLSEPWHGPGEINIGVFRRDAPQEPIRQAAIILDDSEYYALSCEFEPLPTSNNQDYRLTVNLVQGPPLTLATSSGASYLNGALYLNDIPQDQQLTFGLVYRASNYWLGLLEECAQWVTWLALAGWLFIIPGWALLKFTWPGWGALDGWSKIGLSIGAGMAIYPLLMALAWLVNLRPGIGFAWLPPLCAAAVLLWQAWRTHLRSGEWRQSIKTVSIRKKLRHIFTLPACAAGVVVAAILFSRFWVIRGMAYPLWGDSYQHSMITQLILNWGGIFPNWLPYAELSSFTYHFGFHSLTAVLAWMSGWEAPQAVLVGGQLLNVAAVVAVYPLATRVGRSQWAGTCAMFIAGLFSNMPMFYTNWGRYTQLAGQTILPVAMMIIWIAAQKKPLSRGLLLLGWLTLGGLALTHYRVLILVALFAIAALAVHAWVGGLWQRARNFLLLGSGAALLFLPWFYHIFSGKILVILGHQLSTPANRASAGLAINDTIGNLNLYFPLWFWRTVPIIIIGLLLLRRRWITGIVLWAALEILTANLGWLGLPGSGAIDNFAVLMSLYLPISVMTGTALTFIGRWIAKRLNLGRYSSFPPPNIVRWDRYLYIKGAFLLCLAAVSLWMARQQTQLILPDHFALATRPDGRAMHWITAHSLPTDRFVVNAFEAYNGYVTAGSDGGWWLPLETGRLTNQPPLNFGNEAGFSTDFRIKTVKLNRLIQQKGISSPQIISRLRQLGYRYIYIGQQQGAVNAPAPMIDLADLADNPHFRLVYRQDRVLIYKILP